MSGLWNAWKPRASMTCITRLPSVPLPHCAEANRLENLTTLCPSCHHKVEQNVRMRSGLAGLAYVLGNLAPLFLMCDTGDLGTHVEPVENQTFGAADHCLV